MLGGGGRRYALWEVLADEIKAIRGDDVTSTDADGASALLHDALMSVANRARAAQPEQDLKEEAADRACRLKVYECARQLNLSALCLSGGGIRSASVSLGVIQALADKKLLRQFDYLSTVSGGGYIGCWLSAWLKRAGPNNARDVIRQLREESDDPNDPDYEPPPHAPMGRHDDPDREPPPLTHLRRYSNYLTPQLGVFSADTWTAVAIVLRNMVVNWLILVPAIALAIIAVKLIATLLIRNDLAVSSAPYVGGLCLVFGWFALGYKLYRLYAPPSTRRTDVAQNRFIFCSLVPAILGGFCFVWLVRHHLTPAEALNFVYPIPWIEAYLPEKLSAMLEFAFAVFVGALVVRVLDCGLGAAARANAPPWRGYGLMGWNFLAWLAAVAVFAVLVWAGKQFAGDMNAPVTLIKNLCVQDPSAVCTANPPKHAIQVTLDRPILPAIFGMPWFLLATMSAHTVYLLLRSASGNGDVEREWLGRASGWHFIAGFSWLLLSAIVLLGPRLYYNAGVISANAGAWYTALMGISGAVTALLGKSGLTPAKGGASGVLGVGSNVVLAIAGGLFATLLLLSISLVVDWPLAGTGVACFSDDGSAACRARDWATMIVVVGVFLAIVDGFANVNRFSIHALYRNRLVRAYLGGARAPDRKPDGFTDFDWDDNVRMAALWNDTRVDRDRNWRPLHVINMALNLAATKNLAWQQRKACSFTVTPFSCGSAERDLGYRPTYLYGGLVGEVDTNADKRSTGITLGTAMAISGAAVSPNMGYHSSPALSFLLTMFNVRLGWWLGNPGPAGEKHGPGMQPPYQREGPLFALRPLLSELFGLTSADSPYVYLSDGGHFEDLGLYEMVRRRCRWIVVCDDDQDGKRGFEDLGNAVRKIWIDLGVRITFPDAPLLRAETEAKPADIPYFAIGTIDYVSDGNRDLPPGKLLYIKPTVRGDEDAADVIAYQRANPGFPAQTTADQWFDEAQLEAYRRLGYLMTHRMISEAAGRTSIGTLDRLFTRLASLDPQTMKPRPRRGGVAPAAGA